MIMPYILWALTTALYSPILFQLYRSRWENIDYTHAYFILPVALWLAWRKRTQLLQAVRAAAKSSTAVQLTALALLTLGALLFVFGWRWDYLSVSTFSLIPVLSGLVLYLYGPQTAKLLRFPLFYLLLMVPPPLGILDAITLPMRHGISVAAAVILRSFHYPLTREGLMLTIGNQEIFMGAPCSGFRSLITLLSLGLAYIHVSRSQPRTKTILVVSLVPLALAGNLLRVLSLCLVTFYFGAEAGQGFFHDFSGLFMFVVLIGGILGLETWLNRPRIVEEDA